MSELRNQPNRLPLAAARHGLALLAALATLAACGVEPSATDSGAGAVVALESAPGASRGAGQSAEHRDLAALRAATARFHRFDEALAADYTFLFLDMCMEDGSALDRGGMGFHYVNTALLDGEVEVTAPEALLYEPGPNGQRRLVAVEYVIPAAAWHEADPPMLFGQEFTLNAFDLWALHVWVWKSNPSGLYADWNPRVSCGGTVVNAVPHH